MNIKKWWAEQSSTDKAVYGLSAACICGLLFVLITGLLVPDITFLSLERGNFQINETPAPFYIDRTTLTRGADAFELQLMVEGNYYEKNDYLIERAVQSFTLK